VKSTRIAVPGISSKKRSPVTVQRGKRKLLDVTIRFADHFDSNLRQADRQEQMPMGNNLIAAAR